MSSSLFHTLNISRQDMLSHLLDLDVTGNNLANFNTAGYKTSRSNFQEILQKQFKEGTQLLNNQMIQTQGAMADATSPLNLAIQGEGFFSVTLPDGTIGYTRDGQFSLDSGNKLVTASGYPVVWTGTPVDGMTNFSVSPDGTVSAQDAAGANVTVGTIQLTRFANPTGMQNHGDNIWQETVASGAAQTAAAGSVNFGTIKGSKVEQSNVDLSQELTHLITLQRSFSMSLKVFQQTDTMISEAINLRKA